MSVHNLNTQKITIPVLMDMKKKHEKIACLTAYDFTTAKLCDQAGLDIILVGDSLSMVFAGEETTLPVTMDQMIYHCKIVSKAIQRAMLIGDMPFMSYQVSADKAIENAGRFLQEAGTYGIKLEGGTRNLHLIERLVDMGIPVMGHLGLTPQSINQFGSYKTRGTNEADAELIIREAKQLETAGCFALILEKIPSTLAKIVSEQLKIPTIGIGAGPFCDGQILVTNDMLGLYEEFKPKFVRHYNNLAEQLRNNFSQYLLDVKNLNFPNSSESY